jgi:hypothetical protein
VHIREVIAGVLALASLQPEPEPGPATAAGIAAYNRGDFAAARAILRPIVFDVGHAYPDPWANAYLAQMFRLGQGAEVDLSLSCALFKQATMVQNGPDWTTPLMQFVAEGMKDVCVQHHVEEAEMLLDRGFRDGLTRREFLLGGTHIVADRLGFHLERGGIRCDVPHVMNFYDVVVSMTAAELVSPDGSGARRHFIETFSWQNGGTTKEMTVRTRTLLWIVAEVVDLDVRVALVHELGTFVGAPYPTTEMPAGAREAVSLRLTPSGEVEWTAQVPRVERGVIAVPQPDNGRRQPCGDFQAFGVVSAAWPR